MGLDIGIWVKEQDEGYGSLGSNPASIEVCEKELAEFILDRFPDCGLGASVKKTTWAFGRSPEHTTWDLSIHVSSRGTALREHGFELRDVHLALYEFVLGHWSIAEYLETNAWESH